jgi:hypothetical protein
MTAQLLPCPFCGGEAYVASPLGFSNIRAVVCRNTACSASGPWAMRDGAAAWNTRANPAAEALVSVLEACRDQFRFYEQSHLAKYDPRDLDLVRKGIVDVPQGRDAYEKARTNAQFAEDIDAALAAYRAGAA